jgi:glycosyltransferase involved in cell wall biosynthesis
LRMLGYSSGGILDRKEHGPNPRIMQIMADQLLVAVSEPDRSALADLAPEVPTFIVSNIHHIGLSSWSYADREDLVYVGNFGHPPNVDALKVISEEIMPSVASALPTVRLLVIGSGMTESLHDYTCENIRLVGRVPAVEPFLRRARLALATVRFGAGVKGKIGQALANGTPVVTTSAGAEGMGLVDGATAVIRDHPSEISQAIVALHDDRSLWHRLSANGRRHVAARYGANSAFAALSALLSALGFEFPTRKRTGSDG